MQFMSAKRSDNNFLRGTLTHFGEGTHLHAVHLCHASHHLALHHVSFFPSVLFMVYFVDILFFLSLVFFYCFLQSCMLISWLSFHFSVDVWSVGCIMAEMVRGSVLFPGTDRILKLNIHQSATLSHLVV